MVGRAWCGKKLTGGPAAAGRRAVRGSGVDEPPRPLPPRGSSARLHRGCLLASLAAQRSAQPPAQAGHVVALSMNPSLRRAPAPLADASLSVTRLALGIRVRAAGSPRGSAER